MVLAAVQEDHVCCERCTWLARYARELADRMQLRDWTIEVGHDPPAEEDACATVEMAEGRRLARLRVVEDFEELSSEDQRHAVVHELCHPIVRDMVTTVREGARQEFGGSAFRVFIGAVERDMERTVDTFALIISPSLPTPRARL